MKYFKTLEELTFSTDKYTEFKMISKTSNKYEYEFIYDDIEFEVNFCKNIVSRNITTKEEYIMWDRQYDKKGTNLWTSFSTLKSNAFAIMQYVTNITKDFIEKENPNSIIIKHLYLSDEDRTKLINKRQKLNIEYLKNLTNEYNIITFAIAGMSFINNEYDFSVTLLYKNIDIENVKKYCSRTNVHISKIEKIK